MIVEIQVEIELIDEDAGDPEIGDPLSDRMMSSVREAITNSLQHSYEEGFSHEMEDITAISFDGVSVKRIR